MDVSVIVPCFRTPGNFLAQALTSADAQTRPPREIFVLEGSDDPASEAVCARFGDRVRFVRMPGATHAQRVNFAAREARGELLAFLDSDDVWAPTKLERQVQFLARHPELDLLHCFTEIVDADGAPLPDLTAQRRAADLRMRRAGYGFASVARECSMFNSTVVMRRASFLRVGGLDEACEPLSDLDLFLRTAHSGQIDALADSLVLYRSHGENWSMKLRLIADSRRRVARKHIATVGPDASREFREARSWLQVQEAEASFILGDYAAARKAYGQAARAMPSLLFRPLWGGHFLLPHIVMSLVPRLASRLRARRARGPEAA